ncbi:MAG: ABC transporter permease [Candidatus Merdivicinus sp.]|jgi:putative aldouronate transport system permease protein
MTTAQRADAAHTLPQKRTLWQRAVRELKQNKYVYIMAVPVILYYIIFCYQPMYGAQIAFKRFEIAKGIAGSQWVGFKYFTDFITGPYFFRLMRNTLLISFYQLLFAFPAPILLAILLNELRSNRFKRTVQTIIYLPHFISMVIICGMIHSFVSRDGVITDLCVALGMTRTNMLGDPRFFRSIYTISGIWQGVGWGTIIYLSALTSIDPQLYEAAIVDGANRFHQMRYVTIPGITPTIVTMFILQLGKVMSVGFEKIILLYNPNTYEVADVISSYVYRMGLSEGTQFSATTAIGLFSSAINFLMIVAANTLSKKLTNSSLW